MEHIEKLAQVLSRLTGPIKTNFFSLKLIWKCYSFKIRLEHTKIEFPFNTKSSNRYCSFALNLKSLAEIGVQTTVIYPNINDPIRNYYIFESDSSIITLQNSEAQIKNTVDIIKSLMHICEKVVLRVRILLS